jgi:hypothetical protein
VTRIKYRTRGNGVRFPAEARIFIFLITQILAVNPKHPPIQPVPFGFYVSTVKGISTCRGKSQTYGYMARAGTILPLPLPLPINILCITRVPLGVLARVIRSYHGALERELPYFIRSL